MSTMPHDNPQDEEVELDMEKDPEEEETDEDTSSDDDDIDPVVEQEIKKVIVEEDTPKNKAQVLPNQLIHQELGPDDLFDDGSI